MRIVGLGELVLIMEGRLGIPAEQLSLPVARSRLLDVALLQARAKDEEMPVVAAHFLVQLLRPEALAEALANLDADLAASTHGIAALAFIEFLGGNGYELAAGTEDDLFHLVRGVANGDFQADDVAAWLRLRLVPTGSSAA
jgi:hypothetical protein